MHDLTTNQLVFSFLDLPKDVPVPKKCIGSVSSKLTQYPYIEGGDEAEVHEFPWVVNFRWTSIRPGEDELFCAGALIEPV